MLCGHGAFSFCNFLATANKGGNVAFFTSGAAFCNPARSAVILSWCVGALRQILHGKITNLFPKRRNGAREITGTAGKNCPPPVFRLILPKVVDDPRSDQTDMQRRIAGAEKIGHATNRKISAQNRAHENGKRNNFGYVKK